MAREAKKAESADTNAIATPLGVITRWANHHFFNLMNQRAGVQMDRSSMEILNQVGVHGALRISVLAKVLGLDPSTVSRQVAAAERAGYVKRSPDPNDARVSLLSPTEEGRKIHDRLIVAWREVVFEVFEDLPPKERAVIARGLERIVNKLVVPDRNAAPW